MGPTGTTARCWLPYLRRREHLGRGHVLTGATEAAVLTGATDAAGSTVPEDATSQLEGYTFENDPRGPTTIDATSHQGTTGAVIGETTSDADVPYDGVGLTNTQTNPLDRERAAELLSSSDLPPGL